MFVRSYRKRTDPQADTPLGGAAMRFSWKGLILAPLLVPTLFCAVVSSFQDGNAALEFLILMVPCCVISYCTTIFLFLPSLYLLSFWRPMTGLKVLPARFGAGHSGVRAADLDGVEKQWPGLRAPDGKLPDVLCALGRRSLHRDLSVGGVDDVSGIRVAGDSARWSSLAALIPSQPGEAYATCPGGAQRAVFQSCAEAVCQSNA